MSKFKASKERRAASLATEQAKVAAKNKKNQQYWEGAKRFAYPYLEEKYYEDTYDDGKEEELFWTNYQESLDDFLVYDYNIEFVFPKRVELVEEDYPVFLALLPNVVDGCSKKDHSLDPTKPFRLDTTWNEPVTQVEKAGAAYHVWLYSADGKHYVDVRFTFETEDKKVVRAVVWNGSFGCLKGFRPVFSVRL